MSLENRTPHRFNKEFLEYSQRLWGLYKEYTHPVLLNYGLMGNPDLPDDANGILGCVANGLSVSNAEIQECVSSLIRAEGAESMEHQRMAARVIPPIIDMLLGLLPPEMAKEAHAERKARQDRRKREDKAARDWMESLPESRPIPKLKPPRDLSDSEEAALVEAWLAKGRTKKDITDIFDEDLSPDAVFGAPERTRISGGVWLAVLEAELKRRDLLKEGIPAKRKGAEIITAQKGGRPAAVSRSMKARIVAYVRKQQAKGEKQREACEAAALEFGIDPKRWETIRSWVKAENAARAGRK